MDHHCTVNLHRSFKEQKKLSPKSLKVHHTSEFIDILPNYTEGKESSNNGCTVSPSDIIETHIPTLHFLKNQERCFQNSETVGEGTGNEIGNVVVGRRRDWWYGSLDIASYKFSSATYQTHPPHLDTNTDLKRLHHRGASSDIEFKTKIQFYKTLRKIFKALLKVTIR